MTREDPQMKLRMPAELRDHIAELAKANGRSMNAEIVARLEQTINGQSDLPVMAALAYRIANLEIDLELSQLNLTTIATRLTKILETSQLVPPRGQDSPDSSEVEKWLAAAAPFTDIPTDFEASINKKVDAMYEIASAVHNYRFERPTKAVSPVDESPAPRIRRRKPPTTAGQG